MPAENMPAAEVDITAELVHALLRAQHPDLADLPLAPLAFGWDNVLFRLGEELIIRLPRRQVAVRLIESELRWLPVLAPRLPLPIPTPVRAGAPGDGYPWPWTIVPFFPGASMAETPPADAEAGALALGAFLKALHLPAPPDAPVSPVRGVALAQRTEVVRTRIERLHGVIDVARANAVWDRCVLAPEWPGPPLWLHGDLHPANIIVHAGRVSAVVDFGDLTGGDPATDLALAWMTIDAPLRPTFRRAACGCDDATWARARGWALSFALALLAGSADNPEMRRVGERTLFAALEGE